MSKAQYDDLDIIVVGAGFAGMYALYKLRKEGFKVHLVDAGKSVGGTWNWNRYPGLYVDVESVEYSYAFSEELQQEWSWSERYASRDEILEYLNHVADRFDLRKDISLQTQIVSALFNEQSNMWTLTSKNGEQLQAKHCIMATGFLSQPNRPNFPGQETFKGDIYYTTKWPEEKVDFSGKKVAVIGTGSSGVQTISAIAKEVGELTVFQRTAGYCLPLRNGPMDPKFEKSVKANYKEWRRHEREESFGGWIANNGEMMTLPTESALEVSEQERQALYEDRYKNGGLAMYNIYADVYADEKANETVAKFMQEKIRERIKDPKLAELLIPNKFPALCKRLIADTNYYEVYEQENVSLVDVSKMSIEFNEKGMVVGGQQHDFDIVIFATGYDAMTGALSNFPILGRGGYSLKEHWEAGPRTAIGMMSNKFPNLYYLNGPGSPSPLYQPVLLCEEQTDWIASWLKQMQKDNKATIEPTAKLETEWVEHCNEVINATLFPKAASWYVGRNIPGKPPVGQVYFGGILEYRRRGEEVLTSNFKEFDVK